MINIILTLLIRCALTFVTGCAVGITLHKGLESDSAIPFISIFIVWIIGGLYALAKINKPYSFSSIKRTAREVNKTTENTNNNEIEDNLLGVKESLITNNMNLDEFLTHSSLSIMQVTSVYFKPDIPQDKLVNAIREYAPGVGMSTVNVLIDESFLGSGKEGMIITNEKMLLSKKLGGQEIPLSSVNQIAIDKKNLIVNDLPIAKFSKPELMPLGALGAVLNEFVLADGKTVDDQQNRPLLDYSTIGKLTDFLSRIAEPLYFETAPKDRRKPGATTAGYVHGSAITEELDKLLRFRAGLSTSEVILCASNISNNDSPTDFFCVTNHGVYSVLRSKPVVFISHEDIRNHSAVEEYEESRFIGLRLSNGQGFIVSIQNLFFRPYAFELFTGLIDILNGGQPEKRIT